MSLVAALAPGPVDVVGDIHGEIDALDNLLNELGYAPDGSHADGRRLAFVGDLVDRGPDSPAVLESVSRLVDSGVAQCILGNHELNLLKGDRKHGNSWWTDPEAPADHPMRVIDSAGRERYRAFLAALPLVLERDDLRIVHACWNKSSIDELRKPGDDEADVVELNRRYIRAMHERVRDSGLSGRYRDEWNRHGEKITDPDWQPVFMSAKAEMDSMYQVANPVAVVTSGEEAPAEEPFWAGGKWRMVDRVKWWEHYAEPVPVIVGHYWRRFSEARLHLADKFGPDLFAGIGPHQWMGRRNNVYCIDFSVGARAAQRANDAPPYVCKLAALRVPEWEVVHDDGESWNIGPPGGG